MTNDITQEQLTELEETLRQAKPVPIGIQMTKEAFAYIVGELKICDQSRYKKEQGIQIISTSPTLSKYTARVLYSDNHSETISLREEK